MVTYHMLPPEESLEFLLSRTDWLDDFAARSNDSIDWKCIEANLRARNAIVVVARQKHKAVGFMLLTEERDIQDRLSLFVWVAYSTIHLTRGDFLLALDYLEALAQQMKAGYIKFGTKRVGAWDRRLKKLGFFPSLSVTFERKVNNVECS